MERYVIRVRADGSFAILLPESVTCGGCGRQAMFMVNRGGKTRCTHCDFKATEWVLR